MNVLDCQWGVGSLLFLLLWSRALLQAGMGADFIVHCVLGTGPAWVCRVHRAAPRGKRLCRLFPELSRGPTHHCNALCTRNPKSCGFISTHSPCLIILHQLRNGLWSQVAIQISEWLASWVAEDNQVWGYKQAFFRVPWSDSRKPHQAPSFPERRGSD